MNLVAEAILKMLTISEFCSIFIATGRENYSLLDTFSSSVLRAVFYRNTILLNYIVSSEQDPKYSDYIDQQNLQRYDHPRTSQQAFDLANLQQLTPLKVWQLCKTTLDLSRNHRGTKWCFDTYYRPGLGTKELSLNFNPHYPVYSLSHQDHGGYFQFSVHSHPGSIRNKKGQDLYYRSGEEYLKTKGGLVTTHWSPNGEYLAVIDRFQRSILTFFKFNPNQGTLRRIQSISFSFNEHTLLSNFHWFDSASMLLPAKNNTLQKLSLLPNNTYTLTNVNNIFESISKSGVGFFGIVPKTNLLFYITSCRLPNHKHDHIYLSRLGQSQLLAKISLSGIVTNYCLSQNKIYVMTRNHKYFAFHSTPLFHLTEIPSEFETCPFANLKYTLRSRRYNYKNKLFSFISIDTQIIVLKVLSAQLPLFDYKGDSSEGITDLCEKERFRKTAKRARLASTKFYLCFRGARRTFFISKTFKCFFSTYHSVYKFCHPTLPIFATTKFNHLFRPQRLKFYLQSRANQKLKNTFPKIIGKIDYARPVKYKKI